MQVSKHSDSILPIIKCPHCGREYLPGEIFMPGELLGKPETIIRDALGKIIYSDYEEGEEPVLVEHFECEQCSKPFVVEASLSFKTHEEEEELDFSEEYVSLLDTND